jgi:hypothetical protein
VRRRGQSLIVHLVNCERMTLLFSSAHPASVQTKKAVPQQHADKDGLKVCRISLSLEIHSPPLKNTAKLHHFNTPLGALVSNIKEGARHEALGARAGTEQGESTIDKVHSNDIRTHKY